MIQLVPQKQKQTMDQVWTMPFREIYRFAHWWLIRVPVRIIRIGREVLLTTDEALQLGANLRLWLAFEPLFGDYGWRGRLIGFLLRGLRVIISVFIYLLMLVVSLVAVLLWLMIPIWAVIVII